MTLTFRVMSMLRNKVRIFFALIACLLIWSSTFVALKFSLKTYTPGSVTLLRFLLCSGILLIYYLYDSDARTKLDNKDLFLCFLVGLTLAGYMAGISFGITHVSSAVTSFIVSTEPIMIAIIAAVFLKETFSWISFGGTILSFAGLIIIFYPHYHSIGPFSTSIVIIILATFSSALYCIFQKPLLTRNTVKQILPWYIWFATLVLLPYLPELIGDLKHHSWQTDLSVTYIALFPTLLASILWTYTISKIPVTLASCMFYLIPFVTLIMSYLFLNESMKLIEFFGGCIAIMGAFIISYQSLKA